MVCSNIDFQIAPFIFQLLALTWLIHCFEVSDDFVEIDLTNKYLFHGWILAKHLYSYPVGCNPFIPRPLGIAAPKIKSWSIQLASPFQGFRSYIHSLKLTSVGFRQPGTCTRRVRFQDFRDDLLLQSASSKFCCCRCCMFFWNSELCMIYMEKWAIISFLLLEVGKIHPLLADSKMRISFQHLLQHLYIYIHTLKTTNSKTGCWTRHLGGNTRIEKTPRRLKTGPWLEVVPTYGTLLPRFPTQATWSRSCQGWFGSPPLGWNCWFHSVDGRNPANQLVVHPMNLQFCFYIPGGFLAGFLTSRVLQIHWTNWTPMLQMQDRIEHLHNKCQKKISPQNPLFSGQQSSRDVSHNSSSFWFIN